MTDLAVTSSQSYFSLHKIVYSACRLSKVYNTISQSSLKIIFAIFPVYEQLMVDSYNEEVSVLC